LTLVDKKNIKDIKNWFSSYVQTFKSRDSKTRQNIILKEKHTLRVCKEILYLGGRLQLPPAELRLAEIAALLHDIGRFEQYSRYKTFIDAKSENHAELGVAILKEKDVLKELDEPVKELVFKTILFHNRATLPVDETESCLFFTRLLRDADKLDIWKVVTDYYYRKNGRKNGSIGLDLPDTAGISEHVYQDLLNRRVVNMRHVQNLNDFKLLQVGWVFDINFLPTFERLKKRGYIEMIREVLPDTVKIQQIFEIISYTMENNKSE